MFLFMVIGSGDNSAVNLVPLASGDFSFLHPLALRLESHINANPTALDSMSTRDIGKHDRRFSLAISSVSHREGMIAARQSESAMRQWYDRAWSRDGALDDVSWFAASGWN